MMAVRARAAQMVVFRGASKRFAARMMCTGPKDGHDFELYPIAVGAALMAGASVAFGSRPEQHEPPNSPRRPASIKLYYSDMHFWRAEVACRTPPPCHSRSVCSHSEPACAAQCVRLCLFIGDIEFEDVRYKVRLLSATRLLCRVLRRGCRTRRDVHPKNTKRSKLRASSPLGARR